MSRQTSKPIDPVQPFLDLQKAICLSFKAPRYEDGWRSLEEVARELSVALPTAEKRLGGWRRAGLLETWRGFVDGGAGQRIRAIRYRVKPT